MLKLWLFSMATTGQTYAAVGRGAILSRTFVTDVTDCFTTIWLTDISTSVSAECQPLRPQGPLLAPYILPKQGFLPPVAYSGSPKTTTTNATSQL